MSERKHTMRWQDDRMAGVDCHVNTIKRPRLLGGGLFDAPTDGGVVNAGEERECESCGARLRLVWDVRLETTETP